MGPSPELSKGRNSNSYFAAYRKKEVVSELIIEAVNEVKEKQAEKQKKWVWGGISLIAVYSPLPLDAIQSYALGR